MKGLVRLVNLGVSVWIGLVAASASRTIARTADDQSVLEADRALIQFHGKGDKASPIDHRALNELLDDDFTWIDSNGKRLNKLQVLRNFPTPANTDAEVQARVYGRSAVVRANLGR